MRELSQDEALNEALASTLSTDNRVLALECTLESESPSAIWQNLLSKYSGQQVKSTPGSPATLVGIATGAAIAGLKPVLRFHSPAQLLAGCQFLTSTLGRIPTITNNNLDAPAVIIAPSGPGLPFGTQHDIALESILSNIPDILVIYVSGAYEMKGCLLAAIQEERPVIILESPLLRDKKENVPETDYILSFDETPLLHSGQDLTLLAWGYNVKRALNISNELENSNIQCDVINIRTLNHLDLGTIANSVQKTHRVAIIEDDFSIGSFGGQLSAKIQKEFFSQINHPIERFSFWKGTPHYLPHLDECDKSFTENCILELRKSLERKI